jgi:peptide deformylase
MILPVHIIGSSVLRKLAEDVEKDFEGLDELIDNMYETMYHSDGIGLAAPQVGKSIRLFILDASPLAEDYPELDGLKRTFINAHITEKKGEMIQSNEGCLSIPDIREDVMRYPEITIEYVDKDFNKITEHFEGIPAVIVQHEYDHLDGILFTDKVSALRKKFLKKKLANIAKGNFQKRYKVVLGEKYK